MPRTQAGTGLIHERLSGNKKAERGAGMRQRLAQATALAVGLAPFFVPGLARSQTSTPTITSYGTTAGVAISSGPPGTQLVIKGTNLGSSGTLRFGGTTLSYNAWASTYIPGVVPAPASY